MVRAHVSFILSSHTCHSTTLCEVWTHTRAHIWSQCTRVWMYTHARRAIVPLVRSVECVDLLWWWWWYSTRPGSRTYAECVYVSCERVVLVHTTPPHGACYDDRTRARVSRSLNFPSVASHVYVRMPRRVCVRTYARCVLCVLFDSLYVSSVDVFRSRSSASTFHLGPRKRASASNTPPQLCCQPEKRACVDRGRWSVSACLRVSCDGISCVW